MKGKPIHHTIAPPIIAFLLILGFIYFSSGISLKVTFVPAMVISLICYYLTTYHKMPQAEKIVPLYFFAIGIQLLHFSEEYLGDFPSKFPPLLDGSPGYPLDLFIVANMFIYFICIIGGIGLMKGWKVPTLIVWFFIIMGVMGNAIVHSIFCILNKGYFPGFYTSLIYWILGPILILRMFKLTRFSKDVI